MNPWQGHPRADVLSRPAAWWEGASADEAWAFGLSICTHDDHRCQDNPPDGSAIPTMSDEELRHYLSLASRLLATSHTRWLERYADQLTSELARRTGVSNAGTQSQTKGRDR